MVMLLNLAIHILVKVEVLVVSLIPKGLQLGTNGVPSRENLLPTKEESVQGPVHLTPILGLAKFSWEEKLVALLIATPNGEVRK